MDEITTLSIEYVQNSSLTEEQKQLWLGRINERQLTEEEFTELHDSVTQAADKEAEELEEQLKAIAAEAERIESEFNQKFKALTQGLTEQSDELKKRRAQDTALMEEIRKKLQ